MQQRCEEGFTLVELVVVIAIVGILAAIAIPRFIDIRKEAHTAQRDSIIGSVRAGILTVAAKNQAANCVNTTDPTFPPDLEADWNRACNAIPGGTATPAPCNTSGNPCFELVIPGGVDLAAWAQTTATTYTYTHPITDTVTTCTYTKTDGTFRCP